MLPAVLQAFFDEARRLGKRTVLDAYCCEGGVSTGWHRAGFAVFGVDLFKHRNAAGKLVGFSQKRYPFPSMQMDAVEFIRLYGHLFDVIVASPPCQPHTAALRAERASGKHRPSLIEATREVIQATGRPYVLENVEGARAHLVDPVELCGTMFGLTAVDDDGVLLEMWRHRLFESNVNLTAPTPCHHNLYSLQVAGSYGGARSDKDEARNERHGGYVPAKHIQQALLGIDWMTIGGMHQSVPPVYAEHLALQMAALL